MKNKVTTIFFLVGIFYLTCIQSYCNTKKYELRTSDATLIIDSKENLIITRTENRELYIKTPLNQLWHVALKNNLDGKKLVLSPDEKVKVEKKGEELQISKDGFVIEGQTFPIEVRFTISVKNNAFCFAGNLNNNTTDWIIESLTYPDIRGLYTEKNNTNIYWPNSLGERFDNPGKFGSRSYEYPSTGGSMAWFSVNSLENGIYIGCHDPQRGSKRFSLSYSDPDLSFKTNISFPVYRNEFKIPDVLINLYKGSWHVASRLYRSWFDTNFKLASSPQWIKENAGLMLVIFKQQNGNVMWDYSDIDRLCDIGAKLNIKLIGLWGWAVGGHDRLYPNYAPDNLMGGRLVLEKAIKRAQKRGFKVIVYSNGTIMDAATDFYRYNGLETAYLKENMRPDIDFYVKHNNTTPVVFAKACPGSKVWRNTMMNVALNSQSLGIDAFYIDQVGVRTPLLCYSKYHDHQYPQEAYTTYRVQMLHEIRNKLRKTDSEFALVTEGTIDALLTDIDVFHGLGPGSIITENAFPSMFRYTFPESIIIQLNDNPVVPRFDANYATIYGLRHEIMSRYQADSEYLANGVMPEKQDYNTVNHPPAINKIIEVQQEDAIEYSYNLIQFENENKDFFRIGEFIDEDGIVVNGKDILTKGFRNGNRIGVVVWNMNLTQKRDYSVSVPGHKFIQASEPGNMKADSTSPLAGNSLRLLIFEKQ